MLTYEEEKAVVDKAVKLGYMTREEIAKALEIKYLPGRMLLIENITKRKAIELLKKNRREEDAQTITR